MTFEELTDEQIKEIFYNDEFNELMDKLSELVESALLGNTVSMADLTQEERLALILKEPEDDA